MRVPRCPRTDKQIEHNSVQDLFRLDNRPTVSVVSKCKCPLFVASDMSGFDKSVSRRRGGGKVRIPRLLRDLQAWWESRLSDFSSSRLFRRLDLLFR